MGRAMQIDPEDRIGGRYGSEPKSKLGLFVGILLLAGIIVGTAMWFNPGFSARVSAFLGGSPAFDQSVYADLYAELGINPLPANVAANPVIRKSLSVLLREKCDSKARGALMNDLARLSYNRESAITAENYDAKCSASTDALTRAYNGYSKINDHDKGVEVASKLIKAVNYNSNYYYWRGLSLKAKNLHERALDDFITASQLVFDKRKLRSNIFINQAKMYEKLGRFCQAMTPIQTFVSFDPAKRNNEKTRAIIEKYNKLGGCGNQYASGTTKIPLTSTKAIYAKVSVNGVTGLFLVDTGASYVALNKKFADKAGLSGGAKSKIVLQTANGLSFGSVAVAQQVGVQNAKAQDVTVVIMGNGNSPLGKKLDGLLGLSFLARFDIKIGKDALTLTTRK